jgi:prevent-host-death family protein
MDEATKSLQILAAFLRLNPASQNGQNGYFRQNDHFDYTCDMRIISATNAKQKFAALLDAAQREPVRIQRHDRDIAVLISAEEYQRLNGNQWGEFNRLMDLASAEAEANGFTEKDL